MRALLCLSASIIAVCGLPTSAFAQSLSDQTAAAIQAADDAAAAAERAAEQARAAMEAAESAAKAARAVANAARLKPGEAPVNENLTVPDASIYQMTDAEQVAMAKTTRSAALSASVANGTNGSTFKSTNTPEIQLVASAGEKTASLAWTLDISGQPSPGRLGIDQMTMTATSKLNDSGNAPILGLKGFSNGTEIKISYVHFGSRWAPSAAERPEVAEARKNCEVEEKGKPNISTLCNPYSTETGLSTFVAKYNPAKHRSLLNAALPGNTHFFGLEFAGNQASYKFLNRSTFKLGKESHFGYSTTVFGGLLLDHGLTSLGGSFTYGRNYQAGDDVTICQATTVVGQTQCITAPDGAPIRSTSKIVAAEARHAFAGKIGEHAKMAIGGEFSYDLNSKAYSIDVPLYLITDEKGLLRGGIRGTYLNQKDTVNGGRRGDVGLSLFVGVPFSVFGQ